MLLRVLEIELNEKVRKVWLRTVLVYTSEDENPLLPLNYILKHYSIKPQS